MKKPSKKVVTVAGIAIVGSIAAGAATVAVKRHKSKTAPKKEESNDDANLFV